MGRAGNLPRNLSRKDSDRNIRSSRLPKEVAEDQHKRLGRRAQATKLVAVLDEDLNVVEEFDSVWESLGFSREESASLEMRSELMMSITSIIRSKGWTQAAAAKHCGVSQPRINDLLRGRIDKFSIDSLVNIASALGRRIYVELREAA